MVKIPEKDTILDEIQGAFNEKDLTSGVQAIKEIFNEKNLLMKTELEPHQIHYYARLYAIAQVLKMPMLTQFCDTELSLLISKLRRGRTEAVEISRQQPEPTRNRGLFGLFG